MAMAIAMDDDVVMRKILWRVPMKAVVRLKLVSKRWYALITSLQEQNKVLVKHQVKEEDSGEIETRFSILDYPFFHGDYDYDYDDDDDDEEEESCLGPGFEHSIIHGSSHGIVCLSPSDDIFLYNPATGELRELPPSILLLPKRTTIPGTASFYNPLPWNPASVYSSYPFNNNNATLPPNPPPCVYFPPLSLNNALPWSPPPGVDSCPFIYHTLPCNRMNNTLPSHRINNTVHRINNHTRTPPWNPINNYWNPINNDTLPWNPINNNTLPWNPIDNNTLPWNPMDNNTLPSNPMDNNTLPFQGSVYSSPSPILISPNSNRSSQECLDSLTSGVGFGYDHISGDFKVVRIVDFFGEDTQDSSWPPRAEVYDLGKDGGGWREIKTPVPAKPANHTSFDIYYQGCYYWWATSFPGELILWFHFSKEVFGTISMPEGLSYNNLFSTLAVFNESIVLFNYPCPRNKKSFDLWKMVKDDDDDRHHGPGVVSWTKLFTIGPLFGVDFPLVFLSSEELLMVDNEGQLILCNIFNTQHCKRLPVKGKPMSFQASLFVKTTLSLRGGGHT